MSDRPSWLHYRSTSTHGYYSVDRSRFQFMRDLYPELLWQTKFFDGYNRFEEDCEVYRIILAFPSDFSPEDRAVAHRVVSKYHPHIYKAHVERLHNYALGMNAVFDREREI